MLLFISEKHTVFIDLLKNQLYLRVKQRKR